MNCGIIFWGNSSYSCKTCRMQRRVIRITVGCRCRDSCQNLLKKLKILPPKSKYIFFLLLFVVVNEDQFIVDSETKSTRQSTNLHLPQTNLVIYIKKEFTLVFPLTLKTSLTAPPPHKKCKITKKNFLHTNSFYSLDEYFNISKREI